MPGRDTLIAGAASLLAVVFIGLSVWLGLSAGIAQRERDRLHAEINTPQTGYRDRLSACQASRANLEAQVESQSRAVDALRTEGEARTAAARQAVAAAEQRRRAAEVRIRSLLNEQPRAGEGVCEAADRLILEHAG